MIANCWCINILINREVSYVNITFSTELNTNTCMRTASRVFKQSSNGWMSGQRKKICGKRGWKFGFVFNMQTTENAWVKVFTCREQRERSWRNSLYWGLCSEFWMFKGYCLHHSMPCHRKVTMQKGDQVSLK